MEKDNWSDWKWNFYGKIIDKIWNWNFYKNNNWSDLKEIFLWKKNWSDLKVKFQSPGRCVQGSRVCPSTTSSGRYQEGDALKEQSH